MNARIVIALLAVFTACAYATTNTGTAVVAPTHSASGGLPAAATNEPAAETVAFPAEEPVVFPLVEEPTWSRFEIGTRMTYGRLLRTDKTYFLGHLNHMDVQHDSSPFKLYADFFFLEQWGVEVTWDRLRAKIFNNADPATGLRSSDGAYEMKGPLVMLLWRYPNPSRWTPSAGIGLAFMSVHFDHAGWWHYGYNSPEHWEALGSPEVPYKGGMRTLDPKDDVGLAISASCDWRFKDHWAAEGYVRYMAVEADTHWVNRGEDKGNTTVPLDNTVLGLGVKYVF